MGVSYNRLWKMLIDKNMKRIEMQYLTPHRDQWKYSCQDGKKPVCINGDD